MKRFIIFSYKYGPYGGTGDIIGSCDSLADVDCRVIIIPASTR